MLVRHTFETASPSRSHTISKKREHKPPRAKVPSLFRQERKKSPFPWATNLTKYPNLRSLKSEHELCGEISLVRLLAVEGHLAVRESSQLLTTMTLMEVEV